MFGRSWQRYEIRSTSFCGVQSQFNLTQKQADPEQDRAQFLQIERVPRHSRPRSRVGDNQGAGSRGSVSSSRQVVCLGATLLPRYNPHKRASLVLAILVALLAGCGSNVTASSSPATAETSEPEQPGNPAVYERIAGLTNCDALKEEFDNAMANHSRANTARDLDTMLMTSAYADAADRRMQEVGCY